MESEFEEEDAFTLVVDVDRQFNKKKCNWGTTKRGLTLNELTGLNWEKRVRLNTLTFKGAQ